MTHITYETYANPHPPPLTADVQELIFSNQPADGWPAGRSHVEHLLDSDAPEAWPSALRQWHGEASQWIPLQVLDWWLDQFFVHDTLHTMPAAWWKYRAQRFTAALADDVPVGGVALTSVYYGDRDMHPAHPKHQSLFYEMRGLVAAPAVRHTAARVGTHLVQTMLQETADMRDVATFAITTNPNAARIFANTGAHTDYMDDRFKHAGASALHGSVCWCVPRAKPLCGECPLRPGQIWFWPNGEGA